MQILSVFLIILFNLLIGCSSNSPSQPTNELNTVIFGDITTIPLTKNGINQTYVIASNNSAQKVSLVNITLKDQQNKNIDNIANIVDFTNCKQIDAHKLCKIKITLPSNNGSLFLKATFANNNKLYDAQQIINYSKLNDVQDSFTYAPFDRPIIMPRAIGSSKTIAIPFILNNDYREIELKSNSRNVVLNYTCMKNSLSKDTLCTAFAKINSSSEFNTKNIIVKLSGITNSLQTNSVNIPFAVVFNNAGSLVTSGVNLVVNPAGSASQTITMLNNGNANVTNIKITANTPLIIGNNTCPASLAAGANCTFVLTTQANITVSGQSSVNIQYNSTSTVLQSTNINVIYITNNPSPAVALTTNTNLLYTSLNSGPAFLPITVTNTGNVNLINMQFTNINSINSAMTYWGNSTCKNGQTLAVGASCSLIIAYQPTVAQAVANIVVAPNATYQDNLGQTLSYFGSSLTFVYSAVSSGIFVIVGDYGLVESSTNATSWSAARTAPFNTSTVSINKFINGANSSYVIAGSDGNVWSSNDGIFWNNLNSPESSSSTPAIVGLVYYNGAYYTTTSTRVESYNLSTASWRASVSSGSNYIFTGLTNLNNNLLLLTRPNSNYSMAIATSTNGTNWTVIPIQNGSTRYALNTGVYDGSNYYVFGESGIGAYSNNLTTSPWSLTVSSKFTINSSIAINIFGAVYYVIAGANGNIYYTNNPRSGGNWNTTTTGTSNQINSIIQINPLSSIVVLSVGNSGTILIDDNITADWKTVNSNTTANLQTAYYENATGLTWVTGTGVILYSKDGGNTFNRIRLTSITYNGSVYIATGSNGVIATSIDLANWTVSSTVTTNDINSINCLQSNLCIAVGNGGTILTSTNGTTWQQVSTGLTNNNLTSFSCGVGNCTIVGSNGTILTTNDFTNLAAWSIVNSPTTNNLNSITFYDNIYLAVGAGGTILYSTDGLTWNAEPSGTTQTLNGVLCTAENCIVAGNNGTLLYSARGYSPWTQQRSFTTTNNLNSITFFNSTFVIAGNNNSIYSSADGVSWTASVSAINNSNANLNAAYSW